MTKKMSFQRAIVAIIICVTCIASILIVESITSNASTLTQCSITNVEAKYDRANKCLVTNYTVQTSKSFDKKSSIEYYMYYSLDGGKTYKKQYQGSLPGTYCGANVTVSGTMITRISETVKSGIKIHYYIVAYDKRDGYTYGSVKTKPKYTIAK